MTEYLNEYLADKATLLVQENFAGVDAEWWWERRLGGGIEVCQVLDPERMSREIAQRAGAPVPEVRRVVVEELGLEDQEPVVLTFELSGETPAAQAAYELREHSGDYRGLASGAYRRVEASFGDQPG
jgi:hypothetical protein